MLPWKPRPAMWCWPQPFGQPLILMWRSGASAATSGCRARCSPSSAPRPRDCVTARRHDSAPGQLTTSATVLAPARPRPAARAACSRPSRSPLLDPAEQQVLLGGHAHRAVAVGLGEIGEDAQLVAGEVAERHRDDGHRVAGCFCRSTLVVRHCAFSAARRRRRSAPARCRGRADPAAADARGECPARRRLGARPVGRDLDRRVLRIEGQRRAALAAERRQLVAVLLERSDPSPSS